MRINFNLSTLHYTLMNVIDCILNIITIKKYEYCKQLANAREHHQALAHNIHQNSESVT